MWRPHSSIGNVHLFELVIGLLFLGAMFSLWANRVGLPYPALLALVGTVLALVPGMPTITLDPGLALALFVAPTLLDAAFDASPRDLRTNLRSIVSLAVASVIVTIAAVAWAIRLVVPDMSWAAAIVLGAIVAPPDASAAAAVLRRLKPPHRMMVILEGESLFNDATALLVYRVAVAAVVTGSFEGWKVVPVLLLTCGGGAVVGYVVARLQYGLLRRIQDIPTNIILQFVGTFAVWLLAEHAGLSAIITVVVYAMTVARRAGGRMNARYRIASYAVWDVVVLVLNVLAFVLIGLQLRAILPAIRHDPQLYASAAAVTCGAVIVSRFVWMTIHTWGGRVINKHRSPPGATLLASWCGMRGIVTLAAALALPTGEFPHRDIIVFCAFCVVLATLVLQGMTLRPLLVKLAFKHDNTVERETATARAGTARAAIDALSKREGETAALLVREYETRLACASESECDPNKISKLEILAVAAQRDALSELRAKGVIGDDAFHVVEAEIDLLELAADTRVHPSER